MRIGFFGDGPWAHQALEYIISESQFKVVYIVARFDSVDPILKTYAEQLQVPFFIHPNVNSKEFLDEIKQYKPEINVSMSFNQILKSEIINMCPHGFINCHAGALPFYRGRNILNWALINGETKFGITVHYVNEGIDTGDIIVQKTADISLSDNYSTLLEKATTLCAQALFEALLTIRNGNIQLISQKSIHPVGFYCGSRLPGDEYLDWDWTSIRIYNFVRAISFPGPGARTYYNGQEIIIHKAELIPNAIIYIGTPGEVVGRDSEGVVIKTGDSTIKITSISETKDKEMLPIVPVYKIGTRLGLNLRDELRKVKESLKELEQQLVALKENRT